MSATVTTWLDGLVQTVPADDPRLAEQERQRVRLATPAAATRPTAPTSAGGTSEGERWPMSKPHFSRLVQREAGEALSVRVCKAGAASTTTRMWTVTPPPEGQSFADWAEAAVESFETVLRRWMGSTSEGAE